MTKMLFFYFSMIFSNVLTRSHIDGLPNLKLLECFEFKKNFWIVGHAFHTSSVQFKDECLRMCLTSSIRRSKCLSAMHVPNDDECVISDQNQITKPELFIENDTPGSFTVNFFRNICADPPNSEGATRLEARLQGYRGGDGIIELAQSEGKRSQALVVISGLQVDSLYDIYFMPKMEGKEKCRKVKNHILDSKLLMTVETDHTGMAIQRWIDIDLDFDGNQVINKLITVVEKSTGIAVDCGSIKTSSLNSTENFTTSRSSPRHFVSTGFLLLSFLFVILRV